ncbi:MAG: hypothetical protein R2712_28140 [Vicinamibacterales bacterium]
MMDLPGAMASLRRSPLRWLAVVLGLVGYARTAQLLAVAAAGGNAPRHRFESAGLILAAGLLVSLVYTLRVGRQPPLDAPPGRSPRLALGVGAVAAIAYAWAVGLGPLSDDYQLRAWAAAGDVAPDEWTYLRPLPLLAWSAIVRLGGSWAALHALNVALHALNAGLAFVVARRVLPPAPALAAGLIVALFPAGPEAVAWTAGVFDLTATMCLLVMMTAWLAPQFTVRNGLTCVAAAGLGLFAKESAIVAPALLAVSAFLLRPSMTRRHVVCAAAVTALCLAYGVGRWIASPELAAHSALMPADRVAVKDVLVRPAGGLVVPFRTDAGLTWPAWLGAVLVLVPLARWLPLSPRATGETAAARLAALGALWIPITAAPLLTQFYVAANLEGSRHAVLPAVGLGWLVAGSLGAARSRAGVVSGIAVLALLCTYAVGLRTEAGLWRDAGAERDAVLAHVQRAADQAGVAR